MRHRLACLAALIVLASPALARDRGAGTMAGARDGIYRSDDGDLFVVGLKERYVGVDGLECRDPKVSGGRLRARSCWANGHLGGSVDVSWKVDGNVIVTRGKRYVRFP